MDNISLQSDICVEDLISENKRLNETIDELKRQIEWFKRQVFGQKSEKVITTANVPDLPGLEIVEEKSEEEIITIKEHTKKKRKSTGEFAIDIPDDLPREDVIIDLPESKKINPGTGEPLKRIGEDITEKLACRPTSYYVKRFIRYKYADPRDSGFGVVQEKMPDVIIPGSNFDTSFMAQVVYKKFGLHLPLNRILEQLKLEDIKVSDQALSSLVLQLGHNVKPLVKCMEKACFDSKVIFTDDTPVKLIVSGKGKTKEARMWIYLASDANGPPYHIYKFSDGRSHTFPSSHLGSFEGIIHADALQAYEKLDDDQERMIVWAPCWAHARRKFFDLEASSAIRNAALAYMKNLFRYEKAAWNRGRKERLKIRQEKEKPIVDAFFKYLKKVLVEQHIRPTSKVAEAIGYILTREKKFRRYLDNPDMRLDNNRAENALRKVVLGRKNWLFVGSERSGEAAANLLSLVQTCRAMNINPVAYLEDIFNRLMSHPAKKIDELLPDRWAECQ